jgi:hypothetical protein
MVLVTFFVLLKLDLDVQQTPSAEAKGGFVEHLY